MIMQMIGKLGEDKKANWPLHLAEIVHAYNTTCSTVTGYSPHYLMLIEGLGSLSTFTSPSLAAARPPQERPPPCMWMNM